jgi:hypothetical protein
MSVCLVNVCAELLDQAFHDSEITVTSCNPQGRAAIKICFVDVGKELVDKEA